MTFHVRCSPVTFHVRCWCRYFAGYSLGSDYLWRFDESAGAWASNLWSLIQAVRAAADARPASRCHHQSGGSGALGDICTHFLHIARLMCVAVPCTVTTRNGAVACHT